MIEPGRFQKHVPRDYGKNLVFRKRLIKFADESESNRRMLLKACAIDPLFFIDAFGWQINPEKFGSEVGPFICHPFQAKAIARIITNVIERHSTVVRKSRYQGGTWMNLFVDDWFTLFHENKNYILLSTKKEAVDNGADPNSLFWKLDYIHRHLPDWMRRGADRASAGNMVYPWCPNNFGQGYASTQTAGLGGRATVVTSDEHGEQRDGKRIRTRTANIGPRVFISAHYSNSSDFEDICNNPDYDQIHLHWTENPDCNRGLYHYDTETNRIVKHDDYQFPEDYEFVREFLPTGGYAPGMRSPWYDLKAKEIGDPRDVACQLDMDPEGASNLVFDKKVIGELKAAVMDTEPSFVGDLHFDPITARPIGLQANAKGSLRLWLPAMDDGRPPRLVYKMGSDVAQGSGGPMATPSCTSVVNEFGQKVGEYASARIEPGPFATYMVALARFFHDAEWAWEVPGPGTVVSSRVVELGYFNFYWKKSKEGAVWTQRDTDIPGWFNAPGGEAKKRLLKDYAAALRDREFVNPSWIALDECLQFAWVQGGKAEHTGERNREDPSEAGTNHGDRVIADALAWMLVKGVLRKVEKAKAVPKVDKFGSSIASLRLLCEEQKVRRIRPWAVR